MRRGALALLVVVLAGCGSAKHATTTTSSVPGCTASEISIRPGRTGVATGNYLTELKVVNIGSRRCIVRGVPGRITAVDRTGARVTVHVRRRLSGTFFGRLVPTPIGPGEHVLLDFATVDVCRHPKLAPLRDPAIELPGGGTVGAKGVTLAAACGLTVSAFGR